MEEENLALRPGVQISVSVTEPTGPGARDPRLLLNDTAHRAARRTLADLDQARNYDTYDGQNQANGPDWYAIAFPEPVCCNCVEMTMGFPYRDGGWWTSLAIEVCVPGSTQWQPVEHLRMIPAYDFTDSRQRRRPYETHVLTFDDRVVQAIRLIGRPGGLAQFTSLARLAVYHRDLTRWNPLSIPEPPVPQVFRLIRPDLVWDLSEGLVKLSGLTIGVPFMEFYLDERRYQQHWRRLRRNYEGEPDLWFLIGEALGWDQWNRLNHPTADDHPPTSTRPYLRLRLHETLASAVAPVVVEDQVLAELKTHPVILKDTFDWAWHRRFAHEHNIPWPVYQAAVRRSLKLSREQLEGAAALIGTIANTIANLAHHLDRLHNAIDEPAQRRKEIIRRAIGFMEEHLEDRIDVPSVAQAVALSPSYFCTLFTQETGHNPSDFLIRLRIERAKEYLAHTQMSVLEVGAALGYSRSYFSRLFKHYVGCSPAAYAERYRVS
jgi:AraC-like DNA-binding protein